jgi:16S rRNA (cytosine967-C5)-methyltransferase
MIAPARLAAYEVLRAVHLGRADAATSLVRTRDALEDSRDRALVSELVLGTLRWRAALDHVIAWAGDRSLDRFDPEVVDILRLGAYQLLHLDRVPAAAVVNDAVNLTKRVRRRSATGTVNAILRRISRGRTHLPLPTDDTPLEYLTIALSHPRWLVERWIERYGLLPTRSWVEFNNQPAPVTLRANTLQASREEVADRLVRDGLEVEPTRYAPDGLVVRTGQSRAIEIAERGQFVVQDEASQLVGAFAAPRPGERVLDACAAPGGKTTQMAAAMRDRGLLVATDLRPRRLGLLASRVRLSGASCIHIARIDVRRPLPFGPVFDCVVLDAPCSGLGTIRRDPDVKWRVHEADLAPLAATELQMLDQAAAAVRPGGRLIYSTCSSEPIENDDVFASFLERHGEFEAIDPRRLDQPITPGLDACLDERGRLRTTPHQHGLEAFFAAMAVKRTGGTLIHLQRHSCSTVLNDGHQDESLGREQAVAARRGPGRDLRTVCGCHDAGRIPCAGTPVARLDRTRVG